MSAVNEVMIRKCFTKWEPVVDVVIPASRFNGVSPGPRQLPRCWGFVHFPPTQEGERAAADAIKSLNGTTISELRVRMRMRMRSMRGCCGAGVCLSVCLILSLPYFCTFYFYSVPFFCFLVNVRKLPLVVGCLQSLCCM